jgi:hypothetical protein
MDVCQPSLKTLHFSVMKASTAYLERPGGPSGHQQPVVARQAECVQRERLRDCGIINDNLADGHGCVSDAAVDVDLRLAS